MDDLHFLTAGIPMTTRGKRDIPRGLARIKELGLDGMEMEFVRGIRFDPQRMLRVKQTADELGLILSAHAPYYINLNAQEADKIDRSYDYILETARALETAGGWSLVFHAGCYMNQDKQEVYSIIKHHIANLIEILKKESLRVWVRPETMGKPFQFGTLDEVIRLSQDLGHPVLPCLDLSHIHALTGVYNSYEEWELILKRLYKEIGEQSLKEMHIHYSGIQYSNKGEIRHLILRKSDARYRELLKVLKDYDVRGILICESPNQEGDTLLLKRIWKSLQ